VDKPWTPAIKTIMCSKDNLDIARFLIDIFDTRAIAHGIIYNVENWPNLGKMGHECSRCVVIGGSFGENGHFSNKSTILL
jgi:hypothetical protein